MTLHEIKAAVEAGKTVHWVNSLYTVARRPDGWWYIRCARNYGEPDCTGLTWHDGKTLNGREDQFYVEES